MYLINTLLSTDSNRQHLLLSLKNHMFYTHYITKGIFILPIYLITISFSIPISQKLPVTSSKLTGTYINLLGIG